MEFSPHIATPDRTLVDAHGQPIDAQAGPRRIIIFDTTLRDGEQSPGCSMNLQEKLRVAQALKELGVDVIEAGFPITSPGDFDSVRAISGQIRGPVIAALARCKEKDIASAVNALQGAGRARIHLFLATSEIHRKFKLKKSKEDIIREMMESLRQARDLGMKDIEFSPEDAARTEDEFLRDVVTVAIAEGATTVNIPDTVGYTMPGEFSRKIRYLLENVSGIEKAVISVHCHNDLGMAVANSLAAVEAGAGQVECTINGIGERAGNCSLEEIVMALKTRADLYRCTTNIRTPLLVPTSRLVSHITGARVARNKAIVGQNAFAHEAGIHQHGIIANRETYEIMRPEDVGAGKTELVLGKHIGRALIAERLGDLGIKATSEQIDEIFERFKILADEKKDVTDDDLVTLAESVIGENGGKYHAWALKSLRATSDSDGQPTATITVHCNEDGIDRTETVEAGDGVIDAVMLAIWRVTGIDLTKAIHDPASVSPGGDALSRYTIELDQEDGRVIRGRGVDTDTVQAAARAALSLCNTLTAERKRSGERSSAAGEKEVQ
jgi:2-isopropylmalate synthase